MEKKINPLTKIKELQNGKVEGGFVVLSSNNLIIGGNTEPSNNCSGGVCTTNNCNKGNCSNCVIGCGN